MELASCLGHYRSSTTASVLKKLSAKKFLLHGHFFPFSQSQKEVLKTIGLKAEGGRMRFWST